MMSNVRLQATSPEDDPLVADGESSSLLSDSSRPVIFIEKAMVVLI